MLARHFHWLNPDYARALLLLSIALLGYRSGAIGCTLAPMHGWGTWNTDWLWSLALIAITITIHAVGVAALATALERLLGKKDARRTYPFLGTVALFVGVALSLVVFHAIECYSWAIAYVQLGALPSPADAVLYSVDSMTTRGASGLGAIEAGDGMLLFGVSTAFLFYVMVRVWKSEFV
jgi:hypothetical protein